MGSRVKIKLADFEEPKADAGKSETQVAAGMITGANLPGAASLGTGVNAMPAAGSPAADEAFWDGYDAADALGDSQADFSGLGSLPQGKVMTGRRLGLLALLTILIVAGGFLGFIYVLGEENPFAGELSGILDGLLGGGAGETSEDPPPSSDEGQRVAKDKTASGQKLSADSQDPLEGDTNQAVTEKIYRSLPNPVPAAQVEETKSTEQAADGGSQTPVKKSPAASADEQPNAAGTPEGSAGSTEAAANADQAADGDADKSKPKASKSVSSDYDPELANSMDHKFVYQHYRAIQEIRSSKLRQAAVLLRQGLVDRKFWNRMYAAIGLAEFGTPITIEELKIACEDVNSELIANFFRRFVKRPGEAELYIMRQVLRIADERARVVIIDAIGHSRDEVRDIYLVAATFDHSTKVQDLAKKILKSLKLPQEKMIKLRLELGR